MKRRIFAIVLLAGLLAPVTWLRSPPPERNDDQSVVFARLGDEPVITGEAEFVDAWHLTSANSDFGSYSALTFLGNRRMLAGSDRGKALLFDAPDDTESNGGRIEMRRFSDRINDTKVLVDLESLARDPVSGRIWAGFEGTNSIERVASDFAGSATVRPEAMQGWSSNSGPEAMARLADGRFLVLSEGRSEWGGTAHPGLLFADDPLLDPEVLEFSFAPPPGGYRPVDAAQMPDGRVLVLVRNWSIGLPLSFSVRLVVADPAEIVDGGEWSGREIATISDRNIADNYEGLAVEENGDGVLAIWLISDDNNMSYQRTLLLKLRWDPLAAVAKEKARGSTARPS